MALSYVDNDLFELNVRLSNAMSDWSNGFSMTQLGTVYVKVGILQSTVEYLINATTLCYSSGTSLPYAWDHPSNHKRLVIEINGKEQIIDTSHLGKQRAFQYPIAGANRFGSLVIELIAEDLLTIVRLKHPPASTAYKRASLGAQPIEASEIAYASAARTLVVVWTDTEEVQALSFSLMWLQELSVDLDEDFLYALTDFLRFDSNDATLTTQNSSDALLLTLPHQIQTCKHVIFKDFKRRIHFRRSDAPIRLNALELEHPIVSAPQLIDLITRFYSQEILGQVHKVIGAADFLGNPVGLFNNVIWISQSLQWMRSFKKRRLANRNRPRHVVYGIMSGAASLIRSVTSGVTGVVSQPLKGAHEAGIEGFFKGLGKGLVGVVAKPMIGVMDLATSVSEGIKNTTTVFDTELDRQRLP
ncbi:hypothetical protein BSLG_005660 [Batrachochytrium salamandrivorans]|nr:hypothetical protein BSLG_005660 [Batrachochytrium salamandrivorans]